MRPRAHPRGRHRKTTTRVGLLALACALLFVVWLRRPRDQDNAWSLPSVQLFLGDKSGSTAAPSRWFSGQSQRQPTSRYNTREALSHPLVWSAPFFDQSSFGAEATLLVSALLDAGVLPEDQVGIGMLQNSCEDTIGDHMDRGVHDRMKALHRPVGPGAVVVCHNLPHYYGIPSAKWAACERCPGGVAGAAYTVARAMAETDRVVPDFVQAMASLHEVWVPSRHSAEVMVRSGLDEAKVRLVPLAVNTTFWAPGRHAPKALPTGVQVFGPSAAPPTVRSPVWDRLASGVGWLSRPFRFVSVFKWEERKGWDVLLKAYLKEFSSTDVVELYLLTSPFLEGDVMTGLKAWVAKNVEGRQADRLPRLFVIPDRLSVEDYAGLMAAADAFVLPTRGEGWGLPIMEAMSMGLPVIATAWSGPATYLDDAVGYPLRYSLVPVPHSGHMPAWFLDAQWAEPDRTHLAEIMRHVTRQPGEARRRGVAARRRVLERYSPGVVAELVYAELFRINKLLESKG